MEWLQHHLYTAVCTLIGVIVVGGAIIVVRHSPATPNSALIAWGGSGATLLNPSSYAPGNPVLEATGASLGGENPSISYIPPSANPGDEAPDASDLDALIAILSTAGTGAGSTVPASISGGTSLAYSFIPSGLISTSSPTRSRTAAQQALYDYGNEVGGDILSYDDAHMGDAITLTDQGQDRQNPQKAQAVRDVGAALSAFGRKLASMEGVPASVASLHADLAAGYKDMGAKLALIPDAQRDEDFIKAVIAYNASVETFTKQFVALATFFSLSGVKFGQGDGGSAFTFSGGGAL
jgi:hypothetical protein